MPVSRMKMRAWLEQMLESNSISGLVWVDKEQKIFSIPWKHGARHGWEMDKDAWLFKQWAIHTGKYIEGQNAANPKKWKANFRSAMNSLPDIENVKDKSINKGQQAVRVFKMLPFSKDNRKAKGTKQKKKSTNVKSEDMDYSDAPCPVTHCSQPQFDSDSDATWCTQENTVSSTEHHEATHVNRYEVPDCGASLTVGPDSTNKHFRRFEVSPEHSPAYDDVDEEIFRMCQQMELDSQWTQSSSDGTRSLSNGACTGSYSNSSPGSQWSDTSSDEVEDLPVYACLGDLLPITDDLLNNHIFSQETDRLL